MTDLKPTDIRHDNGQVTRNGKTYGCHCEVDLGHEPDGCVLDYGAPQDCDLATFNSGRARSSRWTCPEWRQVRGVGQ